MRTRYLLLVLVLCLAGTYKARPAAPLSSRTARASDCRIEFSSERRWERGYKIQVVRNLDRSCVLTIFYPWGSPSINPKYAIRYQPNGVGTWQEGTNPSEPIRVAYSESSLRWTVAFDSTASRSASQCVVYLGK